MPIEAPAEPDDAEVRRWLTSLHQPDRLAETSLVDVLREGGRLAETASGIEVGRAAAAVLVEAIERLRPADGAARDEQLPYEVLRLSFVDALKRTQVATRLSISPRQLTRYRTRAIRLLQVELVAGGPTAGAETTSVYRFPPIPAIIDFQPRPALARALHGALGEHAVVAVHGHAGIGKTCLVADVAVRLRESRPVVWYRFRAGVNDSLVSLLFELAEHLRSQGRDAAALALAAGVPAPDPGLVSRLLVRDFDGLPLLLVLDDIHVVTDPSIAGFVEDLAGRLPSVNVVAIGRHSEAPLAAGAAVEVEPMTRLETQHLLEQLGVRTSAKMGDALQRWTAGLPQLIRLAASWLRTASDEEVSGGLAAFTDRDEVQSFLLGSIAELIDSADRAVIDAASVFRQPFNNEALAFAAGLSVGTVRDTSRRLVRAHVGSRSRDGNVAFFHGSVREYFYSRLSDERRVALHGRLADWYGRQGDADEAAYHAARAARTETGRDPA